jgi:FG-GAP-like repeat
MRSITGFVLQPLLLGALTLAQSNSVPVSNHKLAESWASASSSPHTMALEQFAARQFEHAGIKSASSTPSLSFAPVVDYGSGGYDPASVAVADVNGDGKPDIVVANSCGSSSCPRGLPGTVGVLLGNGNGTFQTAVTYGSGGYTNSISVVVADVNGDGKPDLIVANSCADSTCSGDGSVGVLLGNGDGTFRTAVSYDSGGISLDGISVAVADVNGDGKLDVLVLNQCINSTACSTPGAGDGSVGVLLGNGDGTFQTAVAYDSGGFLGTSIAVGDVNGDGKPDVVVAQCTGGGGVCEGEVGVLLGNGNGTFQAAVNYSAGEESNAVALADLTGDGHLDILVTNGSSDLDRLDGSVGVLLGNGNGTFQTMVTYDPGGVAAGLAIADLIGNGKLDALVIESPSEQSGESGTNVAVLPGNGDGTFQSVVHFSLGSAGSASFAVTASVVAADLNGNGMLDLVVGGTTQPYPQPSTSVGVLVNTSGQSFSLAASPTSLTLAARQAGTSTLTISPANGFAQPIALSCSGAPAQATCTVTPSTVTLSGSGSATAQVTVITGAESAALLHPAGFPPARQFVLWLAFCGLSGLVLLSGRSSRSRERHGRLLQGLALTCMLSLALTWSACGGSSSSGPGTPPGTYSLTLTATYKSSGASSTQTTTLTLVVQ